LFTSFTVLIMEHESKRRQLNKAPFALPGWAAWSCDESDMHEFGMSRPSGLL